MNNDTAFASDSEVDPTYDTGIFGSDLAGVAEAERQVGSVPIPRFEKYLLTAVAGEGVASENGPSYARLRLKVVKGPQGTENREFFSNVFFHINPMKTNKDGSKRARTSEELVKAKRELSESVKRLARVLGLSRVTPTDASVEAITAWAVQAVEAAKVFVGEVRIEKGDPEKGYSPRNSLAWRSIASLDDPVKDDKGNVVAGKTAGGDANDKIAAYNAKAAKGGGTTAKSHGPAKPTGF